MKKHISLTIILFCFAFLHAYTQSDLEKAFAEVEKQMGKSKIPVIDNSNYFFFNENKCENCATKLIKDFLSNSDFGNKRNQYIVCENLSKNTYEELKKTVSAQQIFIIKNSLLFGLLSKGLKSTSDLYLINFNKKKVVLAVKLID